MRNKYFRLHVNKKYRIKAMSIVMSNGFYYNIDKLNDPRYIGIIATTRKRATRRGIRNVPRSYGGATLKEVKSALDAIEYGYRVKNANKKYEDPYSWD